MKLSTKFILIVSSVLLFASLISGLNFFIGGIDLVAVQASSRVQTIYNLVEPSLASGDTKQSQQILDTVKARESDLMQLEIVRLDEVPVTVASYDFSMVGKPVDSSMIEHFDKSRKGEPGGAVAGDTLVMYVPLKSQDGSIGYAAHVGFAYKVAQATATSLLVQVLITFAVVMLIAVMVFWFASTRILKRPLNRMTSYAEQIAGGDLNVQFGKELKSKDEVGQLARAFEKMSDNLKDMIGRINDSAQQVAASAQQLTAGAEQTSQATGHIAHTVGSVAAGSEKQVNSVESAVEVISVMQTSVDKITQNAQSVSTTALQASSVALEGNQALQTVVSQMNSIHHTVRELHEMIKRLGDRSLEIGEIVQVITGIAEQTNLLALNAAIEAARAGENGRGFSVVADEVRKLAVQSATSGQQITQLVETIQEETTNAILSMETGTKEVAEGISVVNTAGQSFDRIQRAINEVVDQIQSVSYSVKQMSEGAERVVESINTIAVVADETAGNTQLVSASTEQQLASMNEIADASMALNDMAEELQSLVNKFKV